MLLKIKAKCDECGQEVDPYSTEWRDWFVVARDGRLLLHFCGWRCLARYAVMQAAEQSVRRPTKCEG